ncbi:acyl-CoA dehydrogenase family protein [Marivita sp. S2033]|uniref:acyl-CoA dehydrogenase family protein n=1 Tax=Marivita sp. S2033 TaxID=3373187 RepID=UPI003981D341
MELTLTEDQIFIRDEARRLLAAKADGDALRRIVSGGDGVDADLWKTISTELGWCAMTIPEDQGGVGLGLTELVLLMEAVGERLAPVPLWSTACLAVPLLMAVGTDAARAWLERIAEGDAAATVAIADMNSAMPLRGAGVTATRQDDGYTLHGNLPLVTDAQVAGLILVPARIGDEVAVFSLEPSTRPDVRRLDTLDRTRQFCAVALNDFPVPETARLDRNGITADALEQAETTATLGLAAEQVGLARGAMNLTLDYISERVQFGRTIASFQAVKHRCAALEVDFAELRALIFGAAAQTDPAERLLEVAGARALASDLAFRASEEAIQLHGGVGFTTEYAPHLYFKRAQASWHMLGSPEHHLDRIAAHCLPDGDAA